MKKDSLKNKLKQEAPLAFIENNKTSDNIFTKKDLIIIAGPCSISTEEETLSLAANLSNLGANIFRGMIFKPRTSPHSFQGIGKIGLEILTKVKEQVKIPILTEARNEAEADLVAEHCDYIQIGTRNMSNFQLLKHVGKLNIPVLLKRGMGSNIKEWLCAAEYILNAGNSNVILCERGIRTFEAATRFTLDIAAVPLLKELTHLPVIVDPSHASGKRSLVPPLALSSVAAGANGIMLEVHDNPEQALSDGDQTLELKTFGNLVNQIKQLKDTLNSF